MKKFLSAMLVLSLGHQAIAADATPAAPAAVPAATPGSVGGNNLSPAFHERGILITGEIPLDSVKPLDMNKLPELMKNLSKDLSLPEKAIETSIAMYLHTLAIMSEASRMSRMHPGIVDLKDMHASGEVSAETEVVPSASTRPSSTSTSNPTARAVTSGPSYHFPVIRDGNVRVIPISDLVAEHVMFAPMRQRMGIDGVMTSHKHLDLDSDDGIFPQPARRRHRYNDSDSDFDYSRAALYPTPSHRVISADTSNASGSVLSSRRGPSRLARRESNLAQPSPPSPPVVAADSSRNMPRGAMPAAMSVHTAPVVGPSPGLAAFNGNNAVNNPLTSGSDSSDSNVAAALMWNQPIFDPTQFFPGRRGNHWFPGRNQGGMTHPRTYAPGNEPMEPMTSFDPANGSVMEVPVGSVGCETLECVLKCSGNEYANNKQYCDRVLNTSTRSMYSNAFGNVVSPVVPRP